jgi:hypothetical protein
MGIAAANGQALTVGRAQMGRLIRARRLDPASQAAADAHGVQMRSLHPNHVHEVDPSLCVLYYLGGRQQMMRAAEFYRGKLHNFAKVRHKIWRYVGTDHASGVIWLRYVEAAGETAANLADFLIWMWGRQAGRTAHGVPRILLWDKGSANTSTPVQSLLEALEVRAIDHRAEAPWVKGQVEGAQQIIETHFEARLRLEPVASVEALNAAAQPWAEAWNSNCVPHVDSRVHRPGGAFVRHDLWARIRAAELRELPPREVCLRLLEGGRQERTVSVRRTVSYRHPQADTPQIYDLRGCAGIVPRDKVRVAPLLAADLAVRLWWSAPTGEERVWRLTPERDYDAYGRPLSGPVIGEEHRALPATPAAHAVAALDALAYPAEADAQEARRRQVTPFGGQIDAHSHLAGIEPPTYLPRQGAAITAQAPEDAAPAVPLVRALRLLAEQAGRALTAQEHRWLAGRWPDGVPAAELARLLARGVAHLDQEVAAC